MSFSRILYMICVNEGYLVSEIVNNIDRKTWREIKETLQWPPIKNQLVVYTQLWPIIMGSIIGAHCRYMRVGTAITSIPAVFRLFLSKSICSYFLFCIISVRSGLYLCDQIYMSPLVKSNTTW